ncbi:MAG: HD-GYP domain-containing protein [Oscillospiraceae bacterium]|nr:HD-GYP domain-containing protein [Oscillospiraceae bacterium]
MTKAARVYSWFISLLGIGVGLYCCYLYFSSWGANWPSELLDFIMLVLLCTISRMLPVYINEDQYFDISFISIFTALLVKGPVAAVAITLISTFFVFEHGEKRDEPFRYILTKPLIKTAFNTSNFLLSIYLPGQVFLLCGGRPGEFSLPFSLWPALVFIVLTLICNAAILMALLALNRQVRFLPSLFSTVAMLLPNFAAVAPIGYLLGFIMSRPSGLYFALLFLAPLLVARYAFQLYVTSKVQYYNMVKVLTAALEAKDKYTEGHSRRVESYSVQIAQAMRLSAARVETIRVAALLHDVGKIGVDDGILRKPGLLTQDERSIIEGHPQIGVHILEDTDLSDATKQIILHHHERYDGGGYPSHTDYRNTPLEAYILGVADAFDAMTSDRPYRSGMPTEKALSILLEESGKQFHPRAVDVFIRSMGGYEKYGLSPVEPVTGRVR